MTIPSIDDQIARMEELWPSLRVRWANKWYCAWEGTLKPEAQTYKIEVKHRQSEHFEGLWIVGMNSPDVRVLNPKLDIGPHNRGKLHVFYDPSDPPLSPLCLHYPKDKSWTYRDYVAEKIVPWTCHWLSLFECWEVTGEWLHDGLHPDDDEAKRDRENRRLATTPHPTEKSGSYRPSAFNWISRLTGHSASSVSMEAGSKESIPLRFWHDWSLRSLRRDRFISSLTSSPAHQPAG